MTVDGLPEARRHAVTAAELLDGCDRFSARLAGLSPDEHLQMVATGQIGQANRDLAWTVDLATAHALAALALQITAEALA